MQQNALSHAPSFAGSWSSLKLTQWIQDTIHNSFHFTSLTPVQASLIPLAISKNKDLLVEAVTGSGKTMAYVVPILERLIRKEQELKEERGSEKGLRKNEVFAIVVAPTRELAIQIHAVFERFFEALDKAMTTAVDLESTGDAEDDSAADAPPSVRTTYYPSPLLLISGTSGGKTLSPAPIIVATPGRLSAYLSSSTALRSSAATSTIPSFAKNRHQVSLSQFGVLVLDEADQLLSSRDHLKDMKTIWGCLPRQRRNWLFSATMMDIMGEKASEVGSSGSNMNVLLGGESGLEQAGLRNLTRVIVRVQQKPSLANGAIKRKREEAEEGEVGQNKERRMPVGLRSGYLLCKQSEKLLQLVRVMRREAEVEGKAKCIVYLSTCAAVEYFYRIFTKLPELASFRFFSLHGQLPTPVRSKTLQSFTDNVATPSHPAVLLCTDVAARGLDLPEVDVVVQYDPPTDPKMFSHRAGRTARMGRAGTAVALLAEGREESYVEFLRLRKIPLVRLPCVDADLSERVQAEGSAAAESSTTGASRSARRGVDPDALDLMRSIQEIVLTDRELTDKAAKAFVSSVRAYSKHEASYIFPLKALDLFGMGRSFGLLRLPRMPEVSEWKLRFRRRQERMARREMDRGNLGKGEEEDDEEEGELFGDGLDWVDREVDWDTYAYASKPRETDRLALLERSNTAAALAHTAEQRAESARRKESKERGQTAWSKKLDRKEKREERRGKREKRKDWVARVGRERAEAEEREEKLAAVARHGGAGAKRDGADGGDLEEAEHEDGENAVDEYKSMLREEQEARRAGLDAAAQDAGGFGDME